MSALACVSAYHEGPVVTQFDIEPGWEIKTRTVTERGAFYMALPDRISIYHKPIEAVAGADEEEIREQVRHTVVHEIAHYYGISDERLDELGWD